ncbi:MAG: DUF4156 domain-containing protein [Sideroxydans sp.]|nr:DUF4156 domain-containing protein [Sideroxydans sp.]
MKFSSTILPITAAVLVLSLTGCASKLIGVQAGAERVSLAEANQVASCKLISKNTVSVLAKMGFIVRDAAEVEENLYQLARNDAVDAGADTVVKGESTALGSRTFSLYKCRP